MECFRIDESGYTGFDLLNADQRFQGASAIAISNEEATRVIHEHFPNIKAAELKYRALSRRPSNHPQLIRLIRDLLDNYKCVAYVCDKRYLLTLIFLDYAVEPFYHERGENFYADGQNYATGSMFLVTGPVMLGQPAFDGLLAAFQLAVKEKTSTSLNSLIAAARRINWHEFPEVLGPLAQFAAPECLSAIADPGTNTDAALVVLTSLISRMELISDGPYRVEHDQSKNLLNYHDLLQQLIEHKQEIEFRQTDIASIKFPLKLAEVTQVDSKECSAVQLADILIGSAIEAVNNLNGLRSGGPDPTDVLSSYNGNQFIHLSPSIDFTEQKRFRQGTQSAEMIDYFAANFYTRR
jgi:hypothetical protein